MYCPNCQNRFDEFQNCYKSTEEVVNDNYYYSCFIKCPHCKTYLVQEKIYRLEFLDEEIFLHFFFISMSIYMHFCTY